MGLLTTPGILTKGQTMSMFKMVRVSADKVVGYAPGETITYQLTLQNLGLADLTGEIQLTNMFASNGSGYSVEDEGATVVISEPLATFASVVVDAQYEVTADDLLDLDEQGKSKEITASATFTANEGDLTATVSSEPVVIRRPDYAVAFGMTETSIPINGIPDEPLEIEWSYTGGNNGLRDLKIIGKAGLGQPITFDADQYPRVDMTGFTGATEATELMTSMKGDTIGKYAIAGEDHQIRVLNAGNAYIDGQETGELICRAKYMYEPAVINPRDVIEITFDAEKDRGDRSFAEAVENVAAGKTITVRLRIAKPSWNTPDLLKVELPIPA